jgi:hypothetical protein
MTDQLDLFGSTPPAPKKPEPDTPRRRPPSYLPSDDAELDAALETLDLPWLEYVIRPLMSDRAASLLRMLHHGSGEFGKDELMRSPEAEWHGLNWGIDEYLQELRKLRCLTTLKTGKRRFTVRINRDVVLRLAAETDERIDRWSAVEAGDACYDEDGNFVRRVN